MSDERHDGSDRFIHALASAGKADLLAALLADPGIDVDSMDDAGRTALHLASTKGQIATAQLLIRHGASIEAREAVGNTPLMEAALHGHTAVVLLLLDSGADPTATNSSGQDARVLAAAAHHAPAAQLLRERILQRRDATSQSHIERAHARFADFPADKIVLVHGGSVRQGLPVATEYKAPADASAVLAKEMRASVPLCVFDGWLKQVDGSELNPVGQLAMDRGFPFFLSLTDFGERDAHNVLRRRAGGESVFAPPSRARRFAGDHTLPRGRYFTVCRDATGDDSGTLLGELYSYYNPANAGIVTVIDSTVAASVRAAQESGLGNYWNYARSGAPFIMLFFHSSSQRPNPFARLLGVGDMARIDVAIPLSLKRVQLKNVLDLRQPATARWFAHYFSRLVVNIPKDGVDMWMSVCPNRPKLESIREMLPTLFTQELGGGLFCQMVGRWLRENHVNALIYPSVRSNAAVDIHDGAVVGWTSWNLVDYRDSDAPSLRFLDTTNFWEDQVRVGPGLAVVPAPESNPYESVQVEYVDSGPREGSWRVRGLVAVRRAALAAQQEVYVKYGVDESGLDLTWVDDLSFEPYVRSWVKLFVSHSYGQCVRRGMELLPTIESFEVFQMFLLSLQRSGDEQVTPDLSAAKVLALLSPQVLSVHEHDREMHRLFRITLGVTNPRTELIREQDRVARCRINYYAAACLISQGRHGEAFGHLEACIEEPGEGCLEAHLALAHRTYDYPNGPGL